MSFSTPAEMLARYDARRLGELVRDDDTKATPTQLLSDAVLQAHLDDAAAEISAATRVGERYTDLQLTSLAGTNRLLLVRLNCDLAYGLLLRRRGYPADQVQNLAPGYEAAEQMLQAIREGERIFNLEGVADAGTAVRIASGGPNNLAGAYSIVDEAERYFGDQLLPNTPRQRFRA